MDNTNLIKYKIEKRLKKEYNLIIKFYINKIGISKVQKCIKQWNLKFDLNVSEKFSYQQMECLLNYFNVIEENSNNPEEVMKTKFNYLLQVQEVIEEYSEEINIIINNKR